MSELKCPNCGEIFQIDESSYSNILQQVRNEEFEKELARRAEEISQRKESEMAVLRAEQLQAKQLALAEKDAESSAKDKIIAELQAQLQASETEKKLAVSVAVQHSERESSQRVQEALAQRDAEIAARDRELAELRAQLQNSETAKKLAVTEAVQAQERVVTAKDNEILSLQSKLSLQESESAMRISGVKEQYETQLRVKDEQIAYYKDFKAKQSTKMIGESLEQHCMNAFNQIRMTAFPNAYFEKDNDARTGSKGDFIFKESQNGVEFLSIMFEMKNEGDETATKHKNEDFFKELDKDRKEKGCEYAVLVSMLEADNEFYNTGIVDVSYRYPKMYVVRPPDVYYNHHFVA